MLPLPLILILVFAGTMLLVVGVFVFANRRRLTAEAFARERLLGKVAPSGAPIANILREQRAASSEALNELLSGRGVTEWAAELLARGGSTRTVSEFLLTIALSAAVFAFAGLRFLHGPLGAVLGAAAGGFLPVAMLRRAHGKRQQKFEELLPDALDMLVNALRAGYSLQAAMEFVGNELPAPLGPEFARFYDEQRLGVEVRTALLRLQERVDTYDIRMFVTALLIQRETGGNLAEVLGGIASLMRERVAFRGQVDTLTAEPRMSARILTGLPVAVFFIVYGTNPDFVTPLVTTDTGHMLLAYALSSVVVGYVVLMRIAKIDI